MVFALLGIGAAAAVRTSVATDRGSAHGGLADPRWCCSSPLLGWNLSRQPPAVHPDGGFPAAATAADRAIRPRRCRVAPDAVVGLRSLPDFKSTEAMAYPLVRAGQAPSSPRRPAERRCRVLVAASDAPGRRRSIGPRCLLCDDLFQRRDRRGLRWSGGSAR